MTAWLTRSRRSALLALLLAGAALAAGDPALEKAKAKFEQGRKAYQVGKFSEALDAYTEAYQLKPLDGFLFNIAQCYRQLGNYERAGFFYRRYLALAPSRPANASMVEDLIREVDAKKAEADKQAAAEAEAVRQRDIEAARERAALAEEQAAAQKRQAELAAAERERAAAEERARMLTTAEAAPKPVTKTWWFWTAAVGAVAAGTVAVYAATAPRPRATTFDDIPAR